MTTFDIFVANAARDCAGHPAIPEAIGEEDKREEWIAAKMIGRWKNGTSLVRYPYGPGKTSAGKNHRPDNELLYGA